MEVADLVRFNGEDGRVTAKVSGLSGSEVSGETVDGGGVGIEDWGWVKGRRKGADDGGVPGMLGGVKKWLL